MAADLPLQPDPSLCAALGADDPHDDGQPFDDGVDVPTLSVGDPVTMKSRLLSRQCATCIFRPANLIHLDEGRLKDMVRAAAESYVICHDTLPYADHPGVGPAICRGFYDRYDTNALQVIRLLFGFQECDPPQDEDPVASGNQEPRGDENG